MHRDSADLDGPGAVALLSRLHEVKNAGYGDAWRKRGELLSIFTNLARKYDRLVVALDRGRSSPDERILDTVGDLCIYAGKYLTWLAEVDAEAFAVASPIEAAKCADDGGHQPLARVLEMVDVVEGVPSETALANLARQFNVLDRGLVAQAGGEAVLDWSRKTELAWRIAGESATLLVSLAREHPDQAREWVEEIEAMK